MKNWEIPQLGLGAEAHLKEGYPCGLTKLPSLEGQMLHRLRSHDQDLAAFFLP